MKRIVVQITIVLLLIAALPISYIFIRQASELNENEALVQNVYEQQLETILFTINQNSENIIYSWINRVDIPVELRSEIMEQIVNRLLQYNTSISQIAFFDIGTGEETARYPDSPIEKIKQPDRILIRKLTTFMDQNYQRIEGVNEGEFTTLYYILRSSDNTCMGAFKIHTNTFIDQNLGPGIQQISQNRFNISITDTTIVNNGENQQFNFERKQGIQYSSMWYLPGYRAQIELQTATLQDLVKSRSLTDVYIFWGLVTIVLIGLAFAIFTIRREMKLAELKSEFVSNVSHEIRTPLALISMYAETLLMKRVKNSEKADEYLHVIVSETGRLSTIVNRILSFSKMERDKREYNFTDFDINELINEITGNFQAHFTKNNIDCTFIGNEELIIRADKDSIAEAIINLLDNAVKYSKPENPKIEIRTGSVNGKVYIDVKDNGIGISPKHQKLIFDKFYRVTQGNLAHKAKGSGLGLNIVWQIIKRHNAKIEVKSEPDKGSTFSLIFKSKK
jgi:two-component system phosphate regulon sensor histidine kinase PhoR